MSTGDDYYSYRPLLTLQRPLAVCGLPGTDVGRTARAMNLLSGIPFVWIDRQVEHKLGRAVELVQVEDGPGRRLEHERAIVEDALGQRTPPILALSDVTFTDAELARRVERGADVVLLHLDVDSALSRVTEQARQDARHHWALREGGRADADLIRRRLLEMERRLRHISRVVIVRDRAPLEVAQDLLAELGLQVR